MTGEPPPYPRTPHLWPLAGEQTRSVLPAAEAERWLREPIIVEEKLDGANVSLWCDAGTVRAASRAGSEAMDRARQLGRLRAWSFAKFEPLQTLLADDWVLYGEWMWLRHGVAYDRLPDWLLALDLWHPARGFAPVDERDARCISAGLAIPPRLFAGVIGTADRLTALLGRTAFGSRGDAEGLVLRAADGRRCKLVAPAYRRRSDEAWAAGVEHNALAVAPLAVPDSVAEEQAARR